MKYTTFAELGGKTWRIRRFAEPGNTRWSAFNPSIAWTPDGYLVMFRSSNYFLDPEFGNAVATEGSRVKSNIWVGKLSSTWQVIEESMRKVDFSEAGISFRRGAEDARLYYRDGVLEFTAGIHEPGIEYPKIGRFRLDENYKAKLVEILDDGWLRSVEKNWMPTYKKNETFDYVYSPTAVYRVGEGVVELRNLTRKTKGVRGGSCLWELEDGTYLALIHKATMEVVERYNPRVFGKQFAKIRRYFHCFARYDKNGKLVQLTDDFIFNNYGIEFGAGLIVDNGNVIVSYGVKDVASDLGMISLERVMEMLHDV